MHISPETPQQLERIFALQMMFLGLTVLLGLIVLIQYGSPSRRMNADGIYSAAPMYGVPRYPGPIEDYMNDEDEEDTNSSTSEIRSSAQHSSAAVRSSRSSSAKSREYNRRTQRTRGGLRGRVTNDEEEGGYSPGWFWR